MATRPIFIVEPDGPAFVRVQTVDFTWHAGMARSRKQMSMRSLRAAAQKLHPDARLLEVSRMSDSSLGEQLSAFNLTLDHPGHDEPVPVECVFQSSKQFERGGPFLDLLTALPIDAKRDPRLQASGYLTGFRLLDEAWSKNPPNAFYDWIYINALHRHPDLASAILQFDIFTDIAFNPKKSINCQARAVALYVALTRRGELKSALASREAFLRIELIATINDYGQPRQGEFF